MMIKNLAAGRICAALLLAVSCFAISPTRAEGPPRVVGQSPENEAVVLTMPDGALRVFYTSMEHQRIKSITSTDGGETWSEPNVEFSTGGRTHFASMPLLDHDGELHLFYLRKRGQGRSPSKEYYIDVYHRRTINERSEWSDPDPVFTDGYTGAIRGAEQLPSGRLIVPVNAWVMPWTDLDPAYGRNQVVIQYSDNNGRVWRQSPSRLVAPIDADYNGILYGAVEPTLLQMQDGSLWMLMRNQTGYLYESRSSDDGVTWSEAGPSPFHTSNSPCDLLRLKDGRIILLWNNCEVPPRAPDGDGIDAGRDILHAAISEDDGKNWRGFREIYLDPTRDQSPPRKGDRGTAYPSGTQTADGDIFVVTGQGERARAMIRFGADWLYETGRSDDFEQGLSNWSVFKDIGESIGWWRDRVPGAQLVPDPGSPGNHVLLLRRPDMEWADGATWNFPMCRRGELKLRARLAGGFGGGAIALTDCFHNPSDDLGENRAMFLVSIAADGSINGDTRLAYDRWHDLSITWDLEKQEATLRIDNGPTTAIALQTSTRTGISYLRLRSTSESLDTNGWMVDDVRVRVESNP